MIFCDIDKIKICQEELLFNYFMNNLFLSAVVKVAMNVTPLTNFQQDIITSKRPKWLNKLYQKVDIAFLQNMKAKFN